MILQSVQTRNAPLETLSVLSTSVNCLATGYRMMESRVRHVVARWKLRSQAPLRCAGTREEGHRDLQGPDPVLPVGIKHSCKSLAHTPPSAGGPLRQSCVDSHRLRDAPQRVVARPQLRAGRNQARRYKMRVCQTDALCVKAACLDHLPNIPERNHPCLRHCVEPDQHPRPVTERAKR